MTSNTSNFTSAQQAQQGNRNDDGTYKELSIAEAILNRDLGDLGRAAENLVDQIENYDRPEARLHLTEHKKDVAFRSYLDAAADHDSNLLRAIGDWAGAEHPDVKTITVDSEGGLWLQKAEGKPVKAPERLTKGLTDSFSDLLGDEGNIPVEVFRNIEWITDENLIDIDLGDTVDLDGFTDDVFENVSLTREGDGVLLLEYESRLNLPGILAQHGHDLDGMSADEYAYENQNVLTKTISDRYGLLISNAGEEHATIGGYVTDENWTEATAEQISGLLYSSELVRFYNESDNGTYGTENLSRILVEAVKNSRGTKAA